MARIQLETGARNAMIDTYKDGSIEVATGYDSRSDKYPIHIYVTKGGVRDKVQGTFLSDSMPEAFDVGFEIGREHIDSLD